MRMRLCIGKGPRGMLDFYKANPLKRLAAYVIDLILLVAITAGVVVGMCSAMDYDSYEAQFQAYCDQYSEQFDTDLSVPRTEVQSYSEEQQKNYYDALDALNQDKDALKVYTRMGMTVIAALTAGIFLGYLILELIIPLILKNGQTVGKKIMGLCVMHKHHVRVSALQIILRTIVGKCLIETLIFVWLLLLKHYGILGTTASLIMSVIAMIQGFLVLMSQANCGIHDKLFNTVVADFKQQYIFDTIDERIDYEEAYEAELARREAAYGG